MIACAEGPAGVADELRVEDVAGFFYLSELNDEALPIDGYEGCDSFPGTGDSICTLIDGRLVTLVAGPFLMSLIPPQGTGDSSILIEGEYTIVGDTVGFTSPEFGSFTGVRASASACPSASRFAPGLIIAHTGVRLLFCRDPNTGPEA